MIDPQTPTLTFCQHKPAADGRSVSVSGIGKNRAEASNQPTQHGLFFIQPADDRGPSQFIHDMLHKIRVVVFGAIRGYRHETIAVEVDVAAVRRNLTMQTGRPDLPVTLALGGRCGDSLAEIAPVIMSERRHLEQTFQLIAVNRPEGNTLTGASADLEHGVDMIADIDVMAIPQTIGDSPVDAVEGVGMFRNCHLSNPSGNEYLSGTYKMTSKIPQGVWNFQYRYKFKGVVVNYYLKKKGPNAFNIQYDVKI
ncbi:MAG: hypothetical protein AB2719_07920 [Candidatus Thiodiazotropha sp.]